MGNPIITAEGLGKKYLLTHRAREPYTALRDVMSEGAKRFATNLSRRLSSLRSEVSPPSIEEFWALRDVSFEVKEGDRLGIIGRNGAGKTTLLKILSRITEPTEGRVRLRGRVASLLEVGTGFHPELTGRENIFLNGAILGMTKSEIERKFDEIVDFAEVERFLDTPVKRYSSGMYVRLAFAVAAHLEPEILLVDEVLAVGDAQFQSKCIGKMGEVSAKEGRTVLFVSHNMNAIEQLCSSVIFIDKGTIKRQDTHVGDVIRDYLFGRETGISTTEWVNPGNTFDNPWFKPLHFSVTDANGNPHGNICSNDEELLIRIEGKITEIEPALQIGYALFSEDGNLLYWSCHTDTEQATWPILSNGDCTITSRFPSHLLNQGTYRIELLIALYYKQWLCQPGNNAPAISLHIQGGLSNSPYWMTRRPGILAPVLNWKKE